MLDLFTLLVPRLCQHHFILLGVLNMAALPAPCYSCFCLLALKSTCPACPGVLRRQYQALRALGTRDAVAAGRSILLHWPSGPVLGLGENQGAVSPGTRPASFKALGKTLKMVWELKFLGTMVSAQG